jgi:ketol-acid reductoisomerase
MGAMKIYRDDDADLRALAEKIVAVIGYGNQGQAQA